MRRDIETAQTHVPARPCRAALRTGLVAGTLASLASTLALMLVGRRETGSYSASTNATSHWVWDRAAFRVYSPTMRHTALGYLIHHGMSTFWAVLYAGVHGNRAGARSLPALLAGAGAAAATACAVDYTITPRRLTPGFEQHLSKSAMALVYAAFALGLAAGCRHANRRR
ncbi:hypothetical protein J7E62_00485 [Variovorax paradoxus]|nr:hypothetical protein [Variovorax paradoxus]